MVGQHVDEKIRIRCENKNNTKGLSVLTGAAMWAFRCGVLLCVVVGAGLVSAPLLSFISSA